MNLIHFDILQPLVLCRRLVLYRCVFQNLKFTPTTAGCSSEHSCPFWACDRDAHIQKDLRCAKWIFVAIVNICFLGWRTSRGMWRSWMPSSTDTSLSSITRRQLVLGTLIQAQWAERRLNRNSPVIILKEVTLAANQLSFGKAGKRKGRWEGRKVVCRPLRPGIHWEYCRFCLFSYKQKSYTQALIPFNSKAFTTTQSLQFEKTRKHVFCSQRTWLFDFSFWKELKMENISFQSPLWA